MASHPRSNGLSLRVSDDVGTGPVKDMIVK